MPEPIHLLTSPNYREARIVCGALAASATLDRLAVTCPRCLGRTRRRTTAGGMSERQLQELVRQAALLGQWNYFHVWNSRHSPSGYPDVTAVRGSRLVCAELKRRGQVPTEAQQRWLTALSQVQTVEVYTWTEDDIPTLLEVLQ